LDQVLHSVTSDLSVIRPFLIVGLSSSALYPHHQKMAAAISKIKDRKQEGIEGK
jgi:hypothetical protein